MKKASLTTGLCENITPSWYSNMKIPSIVLLDDIIPMQLTFAFIYPEQTEKILDLLEKIIPSVDKIAGVPQSDLEDVKDDLLSVEEQISSLAPKKNRLQKALTGIKGFLEQISTKVAVTLAADGITKIDWELLVSKIEEYIALL